MTGPVQNQRVSEQAVARNSSADPIQHLSGEFEKQFEGRVARTPWLAELRRKSFARFAATGFPTTREEDWRFTSVQPIAEAAFELATAGQNGVTRVDLARKAGILSGASTLAFIDGHWSEGLSRVQRLPPGVRVESIGATLSTNPDLVRQHLAHHARPEQYPFAALSAAFVQDGAFIHIPANVQLDHPVHLVFLSSGRPGTMTHPRALVVVERGGRAVVQETYLTRDGGGGAFTNAVTELVVGDGGRLDHSRLQREDESSYHVATTQSHQGRDSVLESCSVAFGARLARHDLGAVLGGSGAFLTLNGLSVLDGKQHTDHHTIIDHAQPHCESHEVFNGIFDDHARGIFNGRIVVRPGAQRTDSKQTNNNLLLSADARADSQPQLEIYADDVKCTHGATLGPLDDASMFYLQSRGIDATAARRMLTYGFGADIVSRISNESVRKQLDLALAERLGEMLATAGK